METNPNRSQRLLHVVASFAPAAGGTTEAIRKLAAELCWARWKWYAWMTRRAAYVQGQSFPVHALGPPQGSYRCTPRLQPWLAENLARFDGVVIHGLWQYHGYGSYRMVRGRLPYVVFPHGMLDPYFKRAFPLKHLKKQVYWLAREYRVLRDARAVCFTTAIERDCRGGDILATAMESCRGFVWHLGAWRRTGDATGEFLARFPALRGRRFFLFLSRIHGRRDAICSWRLWRGWRRQCGSGLGDGGPG